MYTERSFVILLTTDLLELINHDISWSFIEFPVWWSLGWNGFGEVMNRVEYVDTTSQPLVLRLEAIKLTIIAALLDSFVVKNKIE